MAVNMACVIADMCDADERGKRDSSGCGYLQRTLTPSDLLDWYADDMVSIHAPRGEGDLPGAS